MTSEMDWRHRAVCRDEDPDLFFPTSEVGPGAKQVAEAKAVCHRCPVQSECLAWALETGQPDGVVGGKTATQRRALRQESGAAQSPQGQRARLEQIDIDWILHLLDAGERLPTVEHKTGVNRDVCRQVWQENRHALNPPATAGGNSPKRSTAPSW